MRKCNEYLAYLADAIAYCASKYGVSNPKWDSLFTLALRADKIARSKSNPVESVPYFRLALGILRKLESEITEYVTQEHSLTKWPPEGIIFGVHPDGENKWTSEKSAVAQSQKRAQDESHNPHGFLAGLSI